MRVSGAVVLADGVLQTCDTHKKTLGTEKNLN